MELGGEYYKYKSYHGLKIKTKKAMIAYLLLIAFLGSAKALSQIPDDMKEMAGALRETCVAETGVDAGALSGVETGNFPNDPKLACYYKCIFMQFGAMSDDGVLDAEAFGSVLPDSLAAIGKSIMACKDTKGADACDTSLKFYECVYKQDPSTFLVI